MYRIEFDHSQVITPSDDDLDRIAKVDMHAANLLAELYRSHKHTRSAQILIDNGEINDGQITGVRMLYDNFPSIAVKDICLVRIPQNAFRQASRRVETLPIDDQLLKRSIPQISDPLIYTKPSVLAAIEIISNISNVQVPTAIRIAYPIDYEAETFGYKPKQVGANYAQFLLAKYNAICL